MANYNVGNIEIGVISDSSKALSSLDKVIAKLQEFKKIDSTLQNVFLRINQLGNGLTKISKINVDVLNSKISDVAKSSEEFVNRLSSIKQPTFQETAESLNRLANAFRQFDKLKNFDFRAMYNSFNSLNRIITPFLQKLKDSETSLVAMNGVLSNLKTRTITKASNELDKASNSSNKLSNGLSKVNSILNKGLNIGKIYFFYNYSQRIINTFTKFITYASDYVEILNKFQVSFQGLYQDNLKSVNQLAQAFGFSTNTLLDYTATFNNMLKGLKGLSDETSATISQTLTRMAIDYSSLFNVSIERSMNAFQSAIAGNIRTLRSISGFDVSETTIFSIYQELGGTKTMRQLNQLEKRLLRIIAIERQMSSTGALGDYARTIETVSNQVKILKEQFIEMSKWIGMNLLVYAKPVIQYANAIVLTIKEMAKALAQTKQEIDGIDYETEFAGFGNSVEDTTNAVEELSKSLSLLGLDKLNILGSSGSSITDGLSVEGNILNALKEYKMNLDKVSYRAKEISERMMTWLGYSKVLNQESGEIEWKLSEGGNNLTTILDIAKTIIGLIVSSKVIGIIAGVVSSFQQIGTILGGSGGIIEMLSSLGATGGIVAGIIALLAYGLATSEEFRDAFIDIGKSLISVINPAMKILSDVFDVIKQVLDSVIVSLTDILISILPVIESTIKFIGDVLKDIQPLITIILENTLKLLQPILEIAVDLFSKIMDFLNPIIEDLLQFSNVIEYIADVFENIISIVSKLFVALKDSISAVLEPFKNSFIAIIDTIKSLIDWDFTKFKDRFIELGNSLKSIWADVGENLKNIWGNVWDSIKGVFVNIINGIINAFSSFVNVFANIVNDLTSSLSNVWTWLGIPAIPKIPTWTPEPIAFAKGGVITQPTNALMGEYANAKNDPEIVAPQSIMKETFLEAVTPLINAILQGDNSLLKALKEKDTNVYLNGRKISEAIYDDLGAVATRKGKVIFASNI